MEAEVSDAIAGFDDGRKASNHRSKAVLEDWKGKETFSPRASRRTVALLTPDVVESHDIWTIYGASYVGGFILWT